MKQKNSITWVFVLSVVLSSCQWHGLRYRELMPGIQPNKEAYEKVVVEGMASQNDAVVPKQQHDEGDDENEHTVRYDEADERQSDIYLPAPLTDRPEMILKRVGYTTSYNQDNRICNWVAWHLTAEHISGNNQRKGVGYQEDTDVPEPRPTNWDYSRSGYDRGHMCPAGDNKWDAQAMRDCFLFTNMCPQDHQLNGGDWNELEMRCRRWAKTYGKIDIVCGPILFRQKHKTIGQNKVVVPEAFFKVVLCLQGKPKAIGFIYRNQPGNRPQGDYVNSVDEVERITGIDFFADLPDDIEQKVEQTANLDDWDR